MSAIIAPCPWCGSRKVTWTIPAFGYHVTPSCEECEAAGPPAYVASRADRDAVMVAAIQSWNGARR
jgi:hypothetical protein